MKHRRFFRSLLAVLGLVLVLCLVGAVRHTWAADLGATAPHPGDSNPAGSHVFLIRLNDPRGRNPKLQLNAYYPAPVTGSAWSNKFIEIDRNAGWNCETYGPENDFIEVTLSTSVDTVQYNIHKSDVCPTKNAINDCKYLPPSCPGGNDNKLFARYRLPAKPANPDSETNTYVVSITVRYGPNVPVGTGTGSTNNSVMMTVSGFDDATTKTPGLKIGPNAVGSGSYNFPVSGKPANASDNTSLSVPFGLRCSEDTPTKVTVGLYDADNGVGGFAYTVRFKIKDIDAGNPANVDWTGGVAGSPNSGNFSSDSFRPDDGNTTNASVDVVLKPHHRYEMDVTGLQGANTVIIALPRDTIFGAINCPSATITAHAQVLANGNMHGDGSTTSVSAGSTVTFYNWVSTKDVQNTGDSTFIYRVVSSGANNLPGAGNAVSSGSAEFPDTAYSFNPEGDKPGGQHAFSVKLNTPGTYCRRTNITDRGPAYVVKNNDPAETCIKVVAGPVGTVTISPHATGGGDAEAGLPTTLAANATASVTPSWPAGANFWLSCSWSGTGGVGSGSANVRVYQGRQDPSAPGGPTCTPSYSVSGAIGTKACITMTLSWLPVAGQPKWNIPEPAGNWSWEIDPPVTSCANFVGKPFLKVYGGDVSVGGGLGTSVTTCTTSNNSAGIQAWGAWDSPTRNVGAGTEFAAMALGAITGFSSGQFDYGSVNGVYDSTRLSFANTSPGSAGNSGMTPACTNYWDTTSPESGNNGESAMALAAGQNRARYINNGDFYIFGNITYGNSANFGSVASIPHYKVVVKGDIYIDNGVTQLDGLYVALPRSDGSGGHIYTCAFGFSSLPGQTLSGCENQLVVNGAFVAKQVVFLRDCGSRVQDYMGGPVFSGASGRTQDCNANHAAEIFNYTPELWMGDGNPALGQNYDAISSLPPVL